MKTEKRFFIIFYLCENKETKCMGNYSSERPSFPKSKDLIKYINEMNPNFEENDIIITNIIELSKIDFEEWNS